MWAGLPELELPISGRVTLATWQQCILVRRGLYPATLLAHDLDARGFACIVHTSSLDGPEPPVSAAIHDAPIFEHELREAIRSRFVETANIDGLHVYTRRPDAHAVTCP